MYEGFSQHDTFIGMSAGCDSLCPAIQIEASQAGEPSAWCADPTDKPGYFQNLF
jgi:hypothetical protein